MEEEFEVIARKGSMSLILFGNRLIISVPYLVAQEYFDVFNVLGFRFVKSVLIGDYDAGGSRVGNVWISSELNIDKMRLLIKYTINQLSLYMENEDD